MTNIANSKSPPREASDEPSTAVNRRAPSAPPRKLGRYRTIGRLGKGGMAEVYLALEHDGERDVKRLVVIKKVIPELEQEDPQFVRMFMDEARLAARLNHANVVQTYEVGQDGESPYLAMEFLDGQSLNVVQRRSHALGVKVPLDVALSIVMDMLQGLHYAHELRDFDGKPLDIVHRDVTPSNVFVKYDGTTKLVDFGIAKSAKQREKTRAGMLKGKLAYMSPEQLLDGEVTRGVDIWAAATVLWEILAGERLFRGKKDFASVQAVLSREIPSLSTLRDDVPETIDAVIRAALERDPKKRIPSAEEFKNRLEDEALKLGIGVRRSAVVKFMQSLFGEAVEQNAKLVQQFLDQNDNELQPDRALRVKTTGVLETEVLERTSSSVSDASVPSTTLANVTPRSLSPDDDTHVNSGPMSFSEGSSADGLREIRIDDDDEVQSRPMWHWLMLVVAITVFGVAAWSVMR